jgi:dihydrofolate reductase
MSQERSPRLKQQPGQDILFAGSGTLARTLMQGDLIDEYRLLVYPIIRGSRIEQYKVLSITADPLVKCG